jgi:UDPglucose 6-dehydrogenase/GDP-mannose 6-dehydrogenase
VRVAVVGTGYVGLVTGVCLAAKGADVTCVDIDESRIRRIQRGEAPIFEPGLDELLERNIGGRLQATTDLRAAVVESDLTLIAVGTPFDGREIDLGAVRAAAHDIGEALRARPGYHVVTVKSTVVPGTTRSVVLPILEAASGKRSGVDFGVGMNPEFLTEGTAVEDFMAPDRIVIGGIDERTCDVLEELYEAFPSEIPRVRVNPTTAELVKYASNALLATAISFANEIANLATALGDTDVVDVLQGVHLSRYLSPLGADGSPVRAPISSFFEAGCGFGGSCLPKDVNALIAHAKQFGLAMPVLEGVMRTNAARPDEVLALVRRHLPELRGANVTILGVAFKPDTDDVRESPAVPIAERLLEAGARLTLHDPVVTTLPSALSQHADHITMANGLESALRSADAVVLVTRWDAYEDVPALLAGIDPPPLFVDGRRMLEKTRFSRYAGIGT